eukprot:136201-Pelagomonas_calceolata.AAC.1
MHWEAQTRAHEHTPQLAAFVQATDAKVAPATHLGLWGQTPGTCALAGSVSPWCCPCLRIRPTGCAHLKSSDDLKA